MTYRLYTLEYGKWLYKASPSVVSGGQSSEREAGELLRAIGGIHHIANCAYVLMVSDEVTPSIYFFEYDITPRVHARKTLGGEIAATYEREVR